MECVRTIHLIYEEKRQNESQPLAVIKSEVAAEEGVCQNCSSDL